MREGEQRAGLTGDPDGRQASRADTPQSTQGSILGTRCPPLFHKTKLCPMNTPCYTDTTKLTIPHPCSGEEQAEGTIETRA